MCIPIQSLIVEILLLGREFRALSSSRFHFSVFILMLGVSLPVQAFFALDALQIPLSVSFWGQGSIYLPGFLGSWHQMDSIFQSLSLIVWVYLPGNAFWVPGARDFPFVSLSLGVGFCLPGKIFRAHSTMQTPHLVTFSGLQTPCKFPWT